MAAQQILIDGRWRAAHAASTFRAENPRTREPLPEEYPVSDWSDCDEALDAAVRAGAELRQVSADRLAAFLDAFASRIEARKAEFVEIAHAETALPVTPRLADGELPRTTNQLRQAAAAAREGSWAMATIDTKNDIRSVLGPLGPICVFGPNNFPFAFGSVSGGDFAAAIAAGNPVIGKANSSHPGTTRLFAVEALAALAETGLPPATVQLIYRTKHEDGERLVSDSRVGGTGYTGSRSAGLQLKAAADRAGKPIYLELSSVNPVVILPGALRERFDDIVGQFATSCLMGTGQFCTNPGMIVLLAGEESERFIAAIGAKFQAAPVGTLLSRSVASALARGLQTLRAAGAKLVTGDTPGGGAGYSHANSLLQVSGSDFLKNPEQLQTEVFGNASLVVVAADSAEARRVLDHLEGNLTGCIYSDTAGSDDAIYAELESPLRQRVGRLLNDKMPTGVAVSPAMNHGGPFPATGHPGFTAVGIPASLRRFAMLQCYDGVRPQRLPASLKNTNPNGAMWRLVDGQWTQKDVT